MRISISLTVILSSLQALMSPTNAAELSLNKGDHICLVGNELGERLMHNNNWESLLQQRFPKQELVVRNLCFPGDEPLNRLRSLNFGTPDNHLKHSQADVILFFFGFNESFAGDVGLEKFRTDLKTLIQETKKKDYSGKGAPRMVLVSPIAFEKTGDRNLPAGSEINSRLKKYTATLKSIAEETGIGFADVFTPTEQLFQSSTERLTLNGVHLNSLGHLRVAPLLDRALFGEAGAPAKVNPRVKAEIDDKNFHWWHRYRAVNGYSIYGKRGSAGSDGTYRNRDVMERERTILDQMCANRDARIWRLVSGARCSGEGRRQQYAALHYSEDERRWKERPEPQAWQVRLARLPERRGTAEDVQVTTWLRNQLVRVRRGIPSVGESCRTELRQQGTPLGFRDAVISAMETQDEVGRQVADLRGR